jgi:hypothetical protein
MGIGRYDNPYRVVEWHRPLPPGTQCEPLSLETADRALAHGWLYHRGGEDTVVCLMHPRANFSRHYAVPALVEAGFAVLCENSRWLNNDATLVHERVLLDVAAGLAAARERYERVVLIGNSGGGSLYTFYLSQASAPSGKRLRETAAGEPLDLNDIEMPGADAMIYLAAHPGEGHFLLNAIDPSLAEEGDPLSCDPTLDPYDPANGFAEPPAESRYDAEFLVRHGSTPSHAPAWRGARWPAPTPVRRLRSAPRWQRTSCSSTARTPTLAPSTSRSTRPSATTARSGGGVRI